MANVVFGIRAINRRIFSWYSLRCWIFVYKKAKEFAQTSSPTFAWLWTNFKRLQNRLFDLLPCDTGVEAEMSYEAVPDDERILSYSPSTPNPSTAVSPSPMASRNGMKQEDTTIIPLTSSLQEYTSRDDNGSIIGSPALMKDRALHYSRETWLSCRPWNEFYSVRALSIPPFASLSDRFSTNLQLYKGNYQVVAAFWLIVFFLWSFYHFIIAAAFFFLIGRWCSHRARSNGALSHSDMVIAVFAALVVIWVTGFGEELIASLVFSCLSLCGHASLHDPSMFDVEIPDV